jgi:DNA-binding transcriptional MerR regulator
MERIFTISQVAEALDVSAGTIRNWEKEFSDFLVVRRDEQGNRYYTLSDIEKFRRIAELREEGFSLGAIRKVFEKFTNGFVEVENTATREETGLIPLNQTMIQTVISEQVQAAMQQVLLGIREHIDQRLSQFEQSYSHLHGEVSLLKQEIDSVMNRIP